MALTITDLEKVQSEHPDWQLELVDGNIIAMGPSDYSSEEVIARLVRFMGNWVDPRRLGRVTGSSAGFRLPNGDLRAPDVSFVSAERLRRSPRAFVTLVPDLMAEVKSATDSLPPLREKIQLFLTLGSRVGLLVDPDKQIVEVYRLGTGAVVLTNADALKVPELFPGWELPVTDLWPPEFE